MDTVERLSAAGTFPAAVSSIVMDEIAPGTALLIGFGWAAMQIAASRKRLSQLRLPAFSRVMLPARNRRDFDEIPQGARDTLEFIWLERVDDAVAAAFEGPHAVTAAR